MKHDKYPTEPTFDEILAPVRQEVEESGITDEELDELFRQARRDYCREERERKLHPSKCEPII